jgi:hypothetical protein
MEAVENGDIAADSKVRTPSEDVVRDKNSKKVIFVIYCFGPKTFRRKPLDCSLLRMN